ncbi:MAG TPA: hypothetical protein VF637_09800 [Sphingomicrobium sp.]
MTGAEFVAWVEGTGLAHIMQSQFWLFSVLETAHFFGLSLLLGAIFIVDMRVLGFFRSIPVAAAGKLIPLAIVGFAINLISGVGFFFSDPSSYFYNPAFKLKMALVIVAGLNAMYFTLTEHGRVMSLPSGTPARTTARVTSALSLIVWFSIILLGRLLPTFEGSTSLFE